LFVLRILGKNTYKGPYVIQARIAKYTAAFTMSKKGTF